MSAPLAACACGAPLDEARSNGVQTLGGMAVEYRTCSTCGSTRAWMGADRIEGRDVGLYLSPETSEVDSENASFLDALEATPVLGAELIRAGVTLARAVLASSGELVWKVLPPEREAAPVKRTFLPAGKVST